MNPARTESPLEQALNYAASVSPQFAAGVRGATPHEIAQLEKACGETLEPDYRDFLEKLGRGLGGLELAAASFDIGTVQAFYASGRVTASGYFLIGRSTGDPYHDVYIEKQTGLIASFPPPPPPARFQKWAETHLRYLAGGLPQMVAIAALEQWRLPSLKFGDRFVTDVPGMGRLPAFEWAMGKLGMEKLFFSNRFVAAFEGPGSFGYATEYPGSRMVVSIFSADANGFAAMKSYAERIVT